MRPRRGTVTQVAALTAAIAAAPISTPVLLGTAHQASAVGTTMNLTTSGDVQPGQCVIIATVGSGSGAVTAASDGLSPTNPYVFGTTYLPGSSALRFIRLVATTFIPSGTNIVLTFAAASGAKYAVAVVVGAGIFGSSTTCLDAEGAGANNGGAASASVALTIPAPTQDNSLVLAANFIVSGAPSGVAETWTPSSGFAAVGSVIDGVNILRLDWVKTATMSSIAYSATNQTSRVFLVNSITLIGAA